MKREISKELQGVISKMLKPLKGLELGIIIEGLSDKKVIPFDYKSTKDKKVLTKLILVAKNSLKAINQKGIIRPRPNEVGNDIEKFVKDAFLDIKYEATTPTTNSGSSKSSGYPDITFIDEFNRINYLECKTYNIDNISTTQRSFYLSPSSDFKVTEDAHHFGISFEIYVDSVVKEGNIYKAKHWKILDLSKLELDVKYEFNSDNKRLYNSNLILAEG